MKCFSCGETIYTYDALGRLTSLANLFGKVTTFQYNASKNAQASYKYDAWGNVLQTSGTITNPYLYVGELGYYSDGDSGMYLLTQRWYNPVIGRFITLDPLRFGEDVSSLFGLYLYSANNPVNLVDPTGLFSKKWCEDWFDKCRKQALMEYSLCVLYVYFGNTEEEAIAGYIAQIEGCLGICAVKCMAVPPPADLPCYGICTGLCMAIVPGIKYAIAKAACGIYLRRAIRECKKLHELCCATAKK